jgi:hypothetical protein
MRNDGANPCFQAAFEAEDLEAPTCKYSDGGLADVFRGQSAACTHALSCAESLNFIDEDDSAWKMRKERHARQSLIQSLRLRSCLGRVFFQNNWEPTFSCAFEERIGEMGDGGKWLCDPHRIVTNPGNCLIYSFGSNNVFDFEEAFHAYRGDCEVHTFDPTARPPPTGSPAAAFVNFHSYGLGSKTAVIPLGGECGSNCPVKGLNTILSELGHTKKVIDIFKIDIEGGEFDAFLDLLYGCMFPRNIRMILIELHMKSGDNLPLLMQKLFLGLQHAGYVIFHKEPNTMYSNGDCIEYAFIRLNDF